MPNFKPSCPSIFSSGTSKLIATPMEYATNLLIVQGNTAAEAIIDHDNPKLWGLINSIATGAIHLFEDIDNPSAMEQRRIINMLHIQQSIEIFLKEWHLEITESEAQAELSYFLGDLEVPA